MDGLAEMRGHLVFGEMAPFDFAPLTGATLRTNGTKDRREMKDAEMMANGDATNEIEDKGRLSNRT